MNNEKCLTKIEICFKARDLSLQIFCCFSVVQTRLRLRFLTAIREKCLDKFVDTFLEEPANQRDEAEDAENEYHQISCWRGHFRSMGEDFCGGKCNASTKDRITVVIH